MKFLAVVAVALTFAASASAAWVPDKSFARTLRVMFERANPTLAVTKDICMTPVLPKHAGATVGVAEVDCLVFSRDGSGRARCFEILWQAGPVETLIPCGLAGKAVRKDASPRDVVRYPAAPAA